MATAMAFPEAKRGMHSELKNLTGTAKVYLSQARAIRRCGELLKQVEADKGGYHGNYAHDGTDTRITRTEAATQAGLSERQKVTALRVAKGMNRIHVLSTFPGFQSLETGMNHKRFEAVCSAVSSGLNWDKYNY